MAGFAIRLYEITIEGSDAAGNVGRDQCRVVIIPSNMTIQDADAIVQKSSVRFPVATTTDLGIMLETKTNIMMKYMYDVGQSLQYSIDAITANKARERDLMVAGEERDPTMIRYDNTPTKSDIKQSEMIRVDPSWIIVAAVGCIGVGFGFVAGIGTVFLFKILPR